MSEAIHPGPGPWWQDHDRVELRKEAYTMALCVAICLLAALSAVSEHTSSDQLDASRSFGATPAIDALCHELRSLPGVMGARITGGGWGGCVVALARPGSLVDRGWRVRAVDGASVETVSTPR